jgi:hypothetical protein
MVWIILLLLIGPISAAYGDSWYDSAWKYRQAVSIPASGAGGTVNDFPVLLRFSSANGVFSKSKPTGTTSSLPTPTV